MGSNGKKKAQGTAKGGTGSNGQEGKEAQQRRGGSPTKNGNWVKGKEGGKEDLLRKRM